MKEYIHLKVELYQKYGLIGGYIVQLIQEEGGRSVYSMKDLYKKIGIFSLKQVINAVSVLQDNNVIRKKKVTTIYYELELVEEAPKPKNKVLPKEVEELLAKIKKDRENKSQ